MLEICIQIYISESLNESQVMKTNFGNIDFDIYQLLIDFGKNSNFVSICIGVQSVTYISKNFPNLMIFDINREYFGVIKAWTI